MNEKEIIALRHIISFAERHAVDMENDIADGTAAEKLADTNKSLEENKLMANLYVGYVNDAWDNIDILKQYLESNSKKP